MKNDHARIEQKNYANVRRYVGYSRYGDPAQVALLNGLYDALEDWLNFFIPSMKCLAKERVGSRIVRRYDAPKTAYQRAIEHPLVADGVKGRLRAEYAKLNPKELRRRIVSIQLKLSGTRPEPPKSR